MAPLFFYPGDTKIFTGGSREHRDFRFPYFSCLIKERNIS